MRGFLWRSPDAPMQSAGFTGNGHSPRGRQAGTPALLSPASNSGVVVAAVPRLEESHIVSWLHDV